jgi:hypothetical protein
MEISGTNITTETDTDKIILRLLRALIRHASSGQHCIAAGSNVCHVIEETLKVYPHLKSQLHWYKHG